LRGNFCEFIPEGDRIGNCKIYDGTDAEVNCLECETGFYYSSSSRVCVVRNNTIANCKVQNALSDSKCDECDDNFVLSSSSNACGPVLDNCKTYASIKSSTSTCSVCSDGYYLDITSEPQICTKGTVDHCLTYKTT
jgi:hypothetical protein